MKLPHLICLLITALSTLLTAPFTHAEENAGRKKTGKGSKNKPTLPVLTEGKAKGCHAYYEGDNYIAKVSADGGLSLTLKDAGQASVAGSVPLNSESIWSINIEPGVWDTKWKKRVSQPIAEFIEHSPPSDNATQVRILSKRTTGIVFETIYEFSPETISTWYRAEPGYETPEEQVLHLAHQISRIECSEKDRKKSKYELKPLSGRKVKYDFFEPAKLGGKDAKSIAIEGPFWGKREITFERGQDKGAAMKPVKYGDVSLRNGSSIWLIKDDTKSSKQEKEQITIHIE